MTHMISSWMRLKGERERLECDLSRVFLDDEDSSGSEEEDKDEVENF